MSTGKYTLREFFTKQDLEQIIIPEIQRDYVWSSENVKTILDSLNEDASQHLQVNPNELEHLSADVKEAALRGLKEDRKYTNIGFIYAYYDSDYLKKYFLIDGQQRLTTMFLLLLALSLKNDKNNFKRSYFSNQIPKINYKVREASQEFMRNFVSAILNDKSIEDIKNSFWYLSEYESDITIQSIINNYTTIIDFISQNSCALDFKYVEDNVEFWYFDTSESTQGEELYIYMNSRGEAVQENEKIKASLLENLSDVDKGIWGKQWEDWQDFFWKNRIKNDSADEGFNIFLKWIKVINSTTQQQQASLSEQESYIKQTMSSGNINSEFLTLEDLKDYVAGLKKIYSLEIPYLQKRWLCGEMDQGDLIRLLPTLMFAKQHTNANRNQLMRFSRFFFNIPRFPHIRRNPDTYCVYSTNLTAEFLSDGHDDVVNLLKYKGNSNYKRILTNEEIFKLSLYATPPKDTSREEIEKEFWKAEDYSLFFGELNFLFYCMGIDLKTNDISSFSLGEFKQFTHNTYDLFGDNFSPDDLLRRSLLTKGDYSIIDGNTPKLGGVRRTFIRSSADWREITKDSIRRNLLRDLLIHYAKLKPLQKDRASILNEIVNSYLEPENENERWISYFITQPKVLKYCLSKNFCWTYGCNGSLDGIYLLRDTKATDGSYVLLSDFIREKQETHANAD